MERLTNTIVFRFLLLITCLLIYSCINNKPVADTVKVNIPTALESKDPFYEFQKALQIKSIDTIGVKVNDLITKEIGNDTDATSFSFSGIKFKYVSYRVNESGHEDCDEGQTRYYFIVNGNIVRSKAIPDSLRNGGFELEPFCSLTLQPEKARKIDLNGAIYLIIPSERGDCTGEFCSIELDHIFEIKNNKVTYLTVDGWQLCDINNDGHVDQIVYNDSPIPAKNSLPQYADIKIWTFINGEWRPLKDKDNEPYFILLGFDKMGDRNSYKLLNYNWVKKINPL